MGIYGREKIGKTTLASMFPKNLFLFFEPGGKSLSVYQKFVRDWKEFTKYILLLEDMKHDFLTVTVDTVDLAYLRCRDAVCVKRGIQHPSDETFGKAYDLVSSEFSKWMARFMGLPMGTIWISHETQLDAKRRSGDTSTRVIPSMKKQAKEVLVPMVDVLLYYYWDEDDGRVMQIVGDDEAAAGNRVKGHFVGINKIPAGDSEEESYKNFVEAYHITRRVKKTKKVVVRR